MQRTTIALLLFLLGPSPAAAELRVALPSESARTAAAWASWGTLGANIAIDSFESWHCERRARCFVLQGTRYGADALATVGAKVVFHRARPCAPNACGAEDPNASLWSGHTSLSFSAVGRKHLELSIALASGTGAGRVLGGKHWITDAIIGGAVGYGTSFIRGR